MSAFEDSDVGRIITEILDRNKEINRLGETNAILRAQLAKAIEALRPFAEGCEYQIVEPTNEASQKVYLRAAEVYKELTSAPPGRPP